jgi:hypothetical protein
MNIVWAPNPLLTTIVLDEQEKRFFRERLRSKYLEDRIEGAYFALDPAFRERRKTTLEQAVASAIRELDWEFTTCDEERDGKTIETYLDERLASFLEDLVDRHVGDCTCVPCSCTKCYAENLLGINTLEGLGKHEASKIGWAFDGGASIEEAVGKLRDYKPVYTPNPNWPEEQWRVHVPRWIEEGLRAHAWLESYRQKHFADATPKRSTGT